MGHRRALWCAAMEVDPDLPQVCVCVCVVVVGGGELSICIMHIHVNTQPYSTTAMVQLASFFGLL